MSNVIDQFETVKDLGVMRNNQVKFNDHVEKAARKAMQKIGWIVKTF